MNFRIVSAPTSRFLSNHAVYTLVSGKYPQSDHADEIAIEVFPHALTAFLIGSPALLTMMWVVVVVGRSLIRILDIFELLLTNACVVHSLVTCVCVGGLGACSSSGGFVPRSLNLDETSDQKPNSVSFSCFSFSLPPHPIHPLLHRSPRRLIPLH